jgi:hypothetical protein
MEVWRARQAGLLRGEEGGEGRYSRVQEVDRAQYAAPQTIDDNDDRWADLVLTYPLDVSGSDFGFSDF